MTPTGGAGMVGRPGRTLGLCLIVVLLATSGCGSLPIERALSTEEIAQRCSRDGGVWRAHVADGYCEFGSPGFL